MHRLGAALAIFSSVVFGQNYVISTFAGGGLPVNIPGTSASIRPYPDIAVDPAGNVFMTSQDYFVVLRLDAATGILTLVAGNGTFGSSGDNGPATKAQLGNPNGVAVDSRGNVYIADTTCACIRKVTNGVITTVAGNGTPGFSGDNGPATNAQLAYPSGLAVDSAGNLYITDTGTRIRKVSNGVITTVAGSGFAGFYGDNGPATDAYLNAEGVAVDSAGNLYIADRGNNRIRKVSNGVITTVAGKGTPGFSGDNGLATGAQLWGPFGVAVDSAGNLYIAENFNSRIRKVSNGVITTVAGNGAFLFNGDNIPATSAAIDPSAVVVDSAGNLYIADGLNNHRVRKVKNGVITTVVGNGTCCFSGDNGPATSAQLIYPINVAADSSGNVYIANGNVRKVSNGVITTVAGNGTSGFSGDNGPATSAQLYIPAGIVVDSKGNLYIADGGNHRIRKVSNGVITTVVGNGTVGFSGDNGPATSAQLNGSFGGAFNIAVDSEDNLYIADEGNNRIRKVSNGVITTVAGNGNFDFSGDNGPATNATLAHPFGIAVDSAGSLYIADSANERIRKVSNGVITTVAGGGTSLGDNGPATSAQLNFPNGVAVDSSGNLYIADMLNQRVRKVSNGVITTIAGGGTSLGDNGPATSASFHTLSGIAVDSSGNVFIVDQGNNRVRVLAPHTPCASSVSPTSLQSPAAGGSFTLTIQTNASCFWTISGLPGWISASDMSFGTGPATVTLVIAANTGVTRGTTLLIAGVSVDVNQAAALGCVAAINPGGQAFAAAGGSGTVAIITNQDCTWTSTSSVAWVTISGTGSGTGNGSILYLIGPNTGAARSGTINIAGISFAVEQQAAVISGLAPGGSLGQVASEGSWDFSLIGINLGASAATARFVFADNNGNPLLLPLTFPQLAAASGPELASTLDRTINPNAQIVMESTGPDNAATLIGSGQLLSNGNVSGFGIFSNPKVHWNAVVPLETRNPSKYILAFDNTFPLTTGVAVASLVSQLTNVPVIIRDDTGAQIGNSTISLRALGHTSFMLNDPQLGFPVTNNKRGTIEFDTPPGGQLSVLGLRANGAALTTLPVLADAGTSGGSITHVAYNGGWTSVFYLVNTGNTSAQFTLSFFDENGNALPVPLLLPQSSASLKSSVLTRTLAAGEMLVVDTNQQDSPTAVVGSATLTTAGNISGFEIFRWDTFNQEASVPLETRTPNSFVLVFDDTNGLTTGVALATNFGMPVNIMATFRDDTGAQIGAPQSISLPAHGHKSFLLPDLLQAVVGKRGMVEFAVPQGAGISVIGLRAKSDGTLTTIPVLTK